MGFTLSLLENSIRKETREENEDIFFIKYVFVFWFLSALVWTFCFIDTVCGGGGGLTAIRFGRIPQSEKQRLKAEQNVSGKKQHESQQPDTKSLARQMHEAYLKHFNMNKAKARVFLTGKTSSPVSNCCVEESLTPSVTLSLARSLPHSLAHCLTRSLTHSLTHSLTNSLTHSLIHSLARSLSHSLPHSLPHSLARSLARSLAHCLTHSLTHCLARPLPHSLAH